MVRDSEEVEDAKEMKSASQMSIAARRNLAKNPVTAHLQAANSERGIMHRLISSQGSTAQPPVKPSYYVESHQTEPRKIY